MKTGAIKWERNSILVALGSKSIHILKKWNCGYASVTLAGAILF
jgi:hypothetical protein